MHKPVQTIGASVSRLDAREDHRKPDGFPADSVLHLRARECGGCSETRQPCLFGNNRYLFGNDLFGQWAMK
jgi:hypothetical protein